MKKRLVEDHSAREKNIGFYWGTGKLAGFGADQKAPPCRFGIDDLLGLQ